MLAEQYIIWSDEHYSHTVKPVSEQSGTDLIKNDQGSTARPPIAPRYASSCFLHFQDAVIAPDLISSPTVVTELVAEQIVMLYALDQRDSYYTLESVSVQGAGIEIEGQMSGRFVIGASKSYRLKLDLAIAQGVAGTITWHFSDRSDFVLIVSAERPEMVWPYMPLYPVKETWRWSTAVVVGRTRRQRIGNALYPQQVLGYSYSLTKEAAIEQELRLLRSARKPVWVPLWLDAVQNISVVAGATQIIADVEDKPFGERAVLYHNATSYEVIKVLRIDGDVLVLDSPIKEDHVDALLIPLEQGLATTGLRNHRNGRERSQSIDFTMVNPIRRKCEPWPESFLERPVITEYRKGMSSDVSFDVKETYTDTGHFSYWFNRNVTDYKVSISLIDTTNYRAFQRRLTTFKGQLNALWLVSLQNDIEIVKASSTDRMVIKNRGFADAYPLGFYVYLKWLDSDDIQYTKAEVLGLDEDGNEIIALEGSSSTPVEPGDLLEGHLMRYMHVATDEWQFVHNKTHTTLSLPLIEERLTHINKEET